MGEMVVSRVCSCSTGAKANYCVTSQWCNSRVCVCVCGGKPRSHVHFTFVLAAITPVYSKKSGSSARIITSQELFFCSYIHCQADECRPKPRWEHEVRTTTHAHRHTQTRASTARSKHQVG